MKRLVKSLIIVALLLINNISYAAWSLAPPKTEKLCSRCHGPEGKSRSSRYPKLAGQSKEYIIKQLWDFKDNSRSQALMSTIVKELSADDIAHLASYFADQSPTQGSALATNLALGKRLYQGGDSQKGIPACSACHGPAGLGNSAAKFPRLAGQYAAYVFKQLQNFQQHRRHNDKRDIMQDISAKMSEEEMMAVANYISGLHD